MDYPTLIQKYLGTRTSQQLQNDIKNMETFATKGGNPEELLKATRSKIFGQSSTTAQKGLETLQQQPTPSPYASSISALKGFEQELGVPEAETAFETAQQQFQKLQREQQLAPGVSRTIFKEKVPLFAESMEDMVGEYTNPDSPNYIQDVGTIAKLVSSRLDNQQAALGDMLSLVNSIYSASTQAAQTATELRGKRLDSLRKTAWDLYNEFSSLDKEITKEKRDLQTFAQKEGIRVQSEAKIAEARESAEARYREPSGGISGLTYSTPGEEQLSDQARAIIEGSLRLEDLSKATKEKIAGELNAAGYKRFKGSYINYQKEVSKLKTAASITLNLYKDAEKLVAEQSGIIGRLKGYGQKISGVAGENPEVKAYEDFRLAAIGPIARAISAEVGVLTQPDIERAEGVTPRITDTAEEVRLKKAKLQTMLYERQSILDELGPQNQTELQTTQREGQTPRLKALDGSIYEYDSTSDPDYQEDLNKGFTPI